MSAVQELRKVPMGSTVAIREKQYLVTNVRGLGKRLIVHVPTGEAIYVASGKKVKTQP